MWQQAYIAMSLAVGEPLDGALGALDDWARAVPLVNALRSDSREARARALAAELAIIATDIEGLEVTWRG